MSEEFIEMNEANDGNVPSNPNGKTQTLLPGFKSVCMRLGLMMIIVFVSRGLIYIPMLLLSPWIETLSVTVQALVNLILEVVFLYLIPIISAVFILKYPIGTNTKKIYSKPKYFKKAMGMFPAGYAAAIFVRILTMILGMLMSNTIFGDSFNVTQENMVASSMPEAVILFIQLAVIAPVFEEFWFRGIVLESLRPYGNGFAIFVSALLFGMTHSNFEQFFYAMALGIVFGYVAIQTQSIVTTTIMHACFNSISGVIILLSSNDSVAEYLLAQENGEAGIVTPAVAIYLVWLVLIMLLLVFGLVMAIIKLVKIKKYRVPKVQTELSAGRRWAVLLTRATMIIAIIMAVLFFIPYLIPNLIFSLTTVLSPAAMINLR